jgi:hypothetical protein
MLLDLPCSGQPKKKRKFKDIILFILGWVKPKTIKFIFVPRHAVLRRKGKDWLAWSQDNVSE